MPQTDGAAAVVQATRERSHSVGAGGPGRKLNRVGSKGSGESVWLAWVLRLKLPGLVPG